MCWPKWRSSKASYNPGMNNFNKHKKKLEKWGLILMAVAVSVMVFNIRDIGEKGRSPASVTQVEKGIGK